MKNNNHVQKFIKSSLSKLSPTNKSKSNKYNNFNLTSFKNNDFTKFISSPKRTKEEVILPKKKVFPYSAYHRKTKSSSQNYIQYQNLMNNENYNLNSSTGIIKIIQVVEINLIYSKKNIMKIKRVVIYYLLVFL